MTWAEAAKTVSDRWIAKGKMTLPPDDPADADEIAFWDEVEALVDGKTKAKPHHKPKPKPHDAAFESEHPRSALGQFVDKPQQGQVKPKPKFPASGYKIALDLAAALLAHDTKAIHAALDALAKRRGLKHWWQIDELDWRAWLGYTLRDRIQGMLGDRLKLTIDPGDDVMWMRLSYLLYLPPAAIAHLHADDVHMIVDGTKTLGQVIDMDGWGNDRPTGYDPSSSQTYAGLGGLESNNTAYVVKTDGVIDYVILHETGHAVTIDDGWVDDPAFKALVAAKPDLPDYFHNPVEAAAEVYAWFYADPAYLRKMFGDDIYNYAAARLAR